jgi:hypothetical protein
VLEFSLYNQHSKHGEGFVNLTREDVTTILGVALYPPVTRATKVR